MKSNTIYVVREKGRYLNNAYDKDPYTHRKLKKAKWQQKTPPITSITHRLWTDLGRSVEVMTSTQLEWING